MKLVDQPQPTDHLPTSDAGEVRPGSPVEVRRRFDRQWARGFEVVAVDEEGYRLRRLSDGAELPVEFAPVDVRAARDR